MQKFYRFLTKCEQSLFFLSSSVQSSSRGKISRTQEMGKEEEEEACLVFPCLGFRASAFAMCLSAARLAQEEK